MAVLKCKMCGAPLEVKEHYRFAQCRYCDSQQTLPGLNDEQKLQMFERATELRLACDFDQAAGVFQSIITQFPEEAEAYWGLVLCKYGIEYVDDPRTWKKIPTCHRTLRKRVTDDADYRKACEFAGMSRWKYEEEAQVIDELQQKILSISRAEQPYDVFICYKETDDVTKRRTEDSITAQDIYTELSTKGYKVFYARVSLRDKAGSEYEPYIYAALMSAKVMLVIGSQQSYFNAVWVKNEWSRYLDMMKDDEKVIIPCYDSVSPEQLPAELQGFQALDRHSISFLSDLQKSIGRVVNKNSAAPAAQKRPERSGHTDATHKELDFEDGVYIGEALGSRPHGYGTRYFENGDKYEGHWHMGVRQGEGTFTYAGGESWSGEWANDKRTNGHGTVFTIYIEGKHKAGEPVGARYDGELRDGKRNGYGVMVYDLGDRKNNRYEGEFLDNQFHGQGTYIYSSGESWSGEWKNGLCHNGRGTVKNYDQEGKLTGERYDGPIVNGVHEGRGVEQYANGDRYEGLFKNNKRNGQGTMFHSDDSSWTGEWKDGRRWNGRGTIRFYKDGKLLGGFYDGPIVNGVAQGQGRERYPNGNRYEGMFADNKRHGRGRFVYTNGDVYEGEFAGGAFHGQGTFTYADGESWSGEWKDDYRWNGKGTVLYYTDGKPNGNSYKGAMAQGKRHGPGILYWKNGDRYEGCSINDQCHGRGTYIYSTGERWNGEWKDNRRWTGQGYLFYNDDKGNRIKNRFFNGHLENGLACGKGILQYADGTRFEGEFVKDKPYNGRHINAQNQVIDTYINGESQNAKSQKRNQIIGDVFRGLAGM